MREMILATSTEGRVKALQKVKVYQRSDFEGLFTAMKGNPVTLRLLDPPLHEFVPHDEATQKDLANKLGLSADFVKKRVSELSEFNPMLGHRGVRLGLTYPEIYDAQVEAIFEGACDSYQKTGVEITPEVMIPLVGKVEELAIMKQRSIKVAEDTLARRGVRLNIWWGR